MDQITETSEVTEALTAKSTTTTLEDLARKGKKRVKVIRAADIATMLTEAVYQVVKNSDLLSDADVEQLLTRSKTEFKNVVSARKQNDERFHDLEAERDRLRQELDEAHSHARGFAESLAQVQSREPQAGTASVDPHTVEMMHRMMSEMAEMKVRLAQQSTEPVVQAPAAAADADRMAAALDKIAANLDDRLDKLGRKMGVSSAVEGQEIKLDSLFAGDQDEDLESNIGDLELKKSTGAGIAGNLERLKKLKGGG